MSSVAEWDRRVGGGFDDGSLVADAGLLLVGQFGEWIGEGLEASDSSDTVAALRAAIRRARASGRTQSLTR